MFEKAWNCLKNSQKEEENCLRNEGKSVKKWR